MFPNDARVRRKWRVPVARQQHLRRLAKPQPPGRGIRIHTTSNRSSGQVCGVAGAFGNAASAVLPGDEDDAGRRRQAPPADSRGERKCKHERARAALMRFGFTLPQAGSVRATNGTAGSGLKRSAEHLEDRISDFVSERRSDVGVASPVNSEKDAAVGVFLLGRLQRIEVPQLVC